jgi:hypothetical protein
MTSLFRALTIGLLVSTAAMAQAPAPEQAAPTREQVERRLQSVGTLIESSSAARQIEASAEPQALERRSEARALYRKAQAAFSGADLAGANRLLEEATRTMVAGARLAKPEQVTDDKKRRDFEARVESVRALLAAQQRIAKEKAAGRDAQEAARSVESQLAQAQSLVGQGRLDDGRLVLDRAYLTAKVSIESMRRGDTLVRSLKFASPREEYDYELDRNDTHRMLVRVLLADRPGAEAQPEVQSALDGAARLRADAERAAGRGDHAGAIKMLEESTRALVRGIRGAGFYIPG